MKLLLAIVCMSFAASAEEVVPPQPIETPAAVAPPGATSGATVGLLVTVGADGTVKEAAVDVSGGPDFDAAALEAVKKWRFRPALRGGVPLVVCSDRCQRADEPQRFRLCRCDSGDLSAIRRLPKSDAVRHDVRSMHVCEGLPSTGVLAVAQFPWLPGRVARPGGS